MPKYFISFFVIILLACKNNSASNSSLTDDIVLAKVYNQKLMRSDLPALNIKNPNKEDSIAFVKTYVSNWIKSELMAEKAANTINNLDRIEQKTNQYRKDLLRATYEKKALESLDIELSEDEIESFYSLHKDYFVFEEDHYILYYILLPKNTSNLQQIHKSISNSKPNAFVRNYCEHQEQKCYLEQGSLKSKSFLKNVLKLNNESIKKSNTFKYHYPNDEMVLIYKITNKKQKGETAPLDIIRKKVYAFALENKKQEYLQNLEEKTYQKAKNDKIFENYLD